jgi:hypothetical protein
MKHERIIIISVSIVLIIVSTLGVFFLNRYLKNESLFFYATGTNEKAFLNSTWKMSPKEVQRANKGFLNKKVDDIYLGLKPELIDIKRFTAYEQDDISLWGLNVNVEYFFFDNMLYAYRITDDSIHYSNIPEILKTLRVKFGNELKGKLRKKGRFQDMLDAFDQGTQTNIKESNKEEINEPNETDFTSGNIQAVFNSEFYPKEIDFEWDTDNQNIYYFQWRSIDSKFSYRLNINARYKPIIELIDKISKSEKEKYF